MEYKGYTALIEYSAGDNCFFGRVLGIEHIISFGGTSVEEIHANFIDMIDDYPAMCADLEVKTNIPASEVMVPISPALYAKAYRRAEYDGVPVQKVMETALENFVTHHA
jgi:predicted HicB family RNase H-like nuclease